MKKIVYKISEEKKLIDSLSQSKLISREQLLDIKSLYNEEVPYHNFLHALKVAEWVLMLPREKYDIIEVRSLFIAALFHDAGHSGTAEDLDEFRSLDLAFEGIINFEKKYNYAGIDYSIVRKAIIGTVFKNRGKNTDTYAILLADLDVSTIWLSFPEFLYYSDFPFCLECEWEIEVWMKDLSFFKFLMEVEKNIFRTPNVWDIFPHWLSNIKRYISQEGDQMWILFEYYRDNDLIYEQFEDFFYKNSSE